MPFIILVSGAQIAKNIHLYDCKRPKYIKLLRVVQAKGGQKGHELFIEFIRRIANRHFVNSLYVYVLSIYVKL